MTRLKKVYQVLFLKRLTKRFTDRLNGNSNKKSVLDIIKQKENYTDKELEKALTKDGTIINRRRIQQSSFRFRDSGFD